MFKLLFAIVGDFISSTALTLSGFTLIPIWLVMSPISFYTWLRRCISLGWTSCRTT